MNIISKYICSKRFKLLSENTLYDFIIKLPYKKAIKVNFLDETKITKKLTKYSTRIHFYYGKKKYDYVILILQYSENDNSYIGGINYEGNYKEFNITEKLYNSMINLLNKLNLENP